MEGVKRVDIYPPSFAALRKQPKVCFGNSSALFIDLNHDVGGKQKREKTDFFSKEHGWVSLSHHWTASHCLPCFKVIW